MKTLRLKVDVGLKYQCFLYECLKKVLGKLKLKV